MLYEFLTTLKRSQKGLILICLDLVLVVVAVLIGDALLTHADTGSLGLLDLSLYLVILLPLAAGLIKFFGLHTIKLNAYGLDDIGQTLLIAAVLTVSGEALTWVSNDIPHVPFAALLNFGIIYAVLSVASRILLRKIVQRIYASRRKRKLVLIYGAGQTGQQLAAALQTDDEFEVACFVDDNPNLHNLSVLRLRVHSPNNIAMLVQRIGIDRVILAMPSAEQAVRLRLAQKLRGLGCEVLALPSFADMVLRGEKVTSSQPMQMRALLGRDALETDLPSSNSTYRGLNILVTGAGGSIGSELCRQVIRLRPAQVVLLDHSEHALYRIQRELVDMGLNVKLVAVLGSVVNPELVRETLEKHDIDVVFHAAAYKHVNIVEGNAFEGVRNNVFGTRIVADEARRAGVRRFILVSTDKAVRPESVMGSSKRLAELVIQDLATRAETTKFSMVRFGNVLGSSGSVIPLFQDQIRNGGPVTVTHPDVTRFFMTVDEAVRLVLLAGSFSRGGDVFVLDMGQPVKILDVAHKMIETAGYTPRNDRNPNGDIPVVISGLQPGEKIHEELLIGSDMLTTPHPKILRAQENYLSELEIAGALQDLRRAVQERDTELLEATLGRWVESGDKPDQVGLTIVGEN
ncbi:UDP-N-acetyl-alpha-D-glucosamine C6 dehydratase [Shimia sp. SK013]|uniref:polysaccharide biosynthesis protein n=1 Tax=Shimia sp. SK013 TaxID=1389006 RepID=UPI0006B5B15A|nr:nucleoside-diphosphate sugar epimerase/dehydratase [Shimia sp. SK013]KPA23439.1 UDP-N-acetyl-alpha-D-glucosamine C6 dehydratase [Shimia sp. SK013]